MEMDKLDASQQTHGVVSVSNQKPTRVLNLKPTGISGIKLSRGLALNAPSSGIQYFIAGNELSTKVPKPLDKPVSSNRVITVEPCTKPYRKLRANGVCKRTETGRKLCPAAIVRHRNNEKRRHSQIDMQMDKCSALLPCDGTSPSKKEQLQKIVVYVCYLEMRIKELCEELNVDPSQLHTSNVLSGIPDAGEPCSQVQNLDMNDFKPVRLINDYLRVMGLDTVKLPGVGKPRGPGPHVSIRSFSSTDTIQPSNVGNLLTLPCVEKTNRSSPATIDVSSIHRIVEAPNSNDSISPFDTHDSAHCSSRSPNKSSNTERIHIISLDDAFASKEEFDIGSIIGSEIANLDSTTEELYEYALPGHWSEYLKSRFPLKKAESTHATMDVKQSSGPSVDEDVPMSSWTSCDDPAFTECTSLQKYVPSDDEYDECVEDSELIAAAHDCDQLVPQM